MTADWWRANSLRWREMRSNYNRFQRSSGDRNDGLVRIRLRPIRSSKQGLFCGALRATPTRALTESVSGDTIRIDSVAGTGSEYRE